MASVSALSYIGILSPDLDEWRAFAELVRTEDPEGNPIELVVGPLHEAW